MTDRTDDTADSGAQAAPGAAAPGATPGAAALAARPTLAAWLAEYDEIYQEFTAGFAAQGIDFEERGAHSSATQAVIERLRDKGAQFRCGIDSVMVNWISSACVACAGQTGSRTFFLSLKCNKNCYFCFNPNQVDYSTRLKPAEEWKAELDAFAQGCNEVTHIALTGGEPLLHKAETLEFFDCVHRDHPTAHTRLYTAGDPLDEAMLEGLVARGLTEIRFSIKLDDCPEAIGETLEKIALAKHYIADVMVEMPAIPGTKATMQTLLRTLDKIGIRGINLLEFCFPLNKWHEFEKRGFKVKNPPFAVLYNYGYAGGLPVAGSELLCLELLEFVIDEGLSLGVHYCSLGNKNRDQIYQQNTACPLDPKLYELDASDFFYKAAKVFDGDTALVRRRFKELGVTAFQADDEEDILTFHPSRLDALGDLPVLPVCSYMVAEQGEGGWVVRELKLELYGRKTR